MTLGGLREADGGSAIEQAWLNAGLGEPGYRRRDGRVRRRGGPGVSPATRKEVHRVWSNGREAWLGPG
jgi:hypothetical protein